MLPEGGIEQLQTENQHHEKRAHNLPRSALRKPAVDPGKDGTHQQNVKGRKEDEDNGRPEKESRLGNGDSDKDAEAAKEAENGGNVGESKDDKSNGASAEFERAQAGAEAVDENAPAQPGQGRILRTRERAEESAAGCGLLLQVLHAGPT